MRSGIKNIIQFFLPAFLMLFAQNQCFSQEPELSSKKHTGLFIGFGFGASQSFLIYEGTVSLSGLQSGKRSALFSSTEVGYFFSDYFGLSSGIGIFSYKTQLSLGTYQNEFITTDSEGETYERRVLASDINEIQKLTYVGIPVCINLRLPLNTKTGFLIQTGINIAVPVNNYYASSGTFTYKGYYPAYNVLLEDLPVFGFLSNSYGKKQGELALKPLVSNFIASAGFEYLVTEKMQIALFACFSKSLSGISEYDSPDKFQLSSDAGQINSLMGGFSKVTTQSIGLRIGIRYYIKY